jgi:hypothetical protein
LFTVGPYRESRYVTVRDKEKHLEVGLCALAWMLFLSIACSPVSFVIKRHGTRARIALIVALLAVLVEPLAASGELTVQYEDAVRVEIASSAVAEFPSPATAAVFVDAVKLAISRGLPTGRGDVEIPGQVQGSEALAHKLSARRAMENQRRIAEEREQRIRDFERVQAEEARQAAARAALRQEAARQEEARREAEAQRVRAAQRAELSEGTVAGVRRLLAAVERRGSPAAKMPLLSAPADDESELVKFRQEVAYAYRN